MKFTALFALASFLGASAMPTGMTAKRQDAMASGPTDTQVLQYALTLENLEKCFYEGALAKFSDSDFQNAGFPSWVRGRVSQISQHESSHVKLLSAALGNSSVAACQYAFPYTDPKSFIGLASYIENLGVSAYAGANQYITDPLYRTVAVTILSVEARHQGFLNGPVQNQNDWSGPYDTPLGLDMVYTLAAQLITSCPDSNAALPVTASTPLTSGGLPLFAAAPGSTVKLDYTKSSSSVAGPVSAVVYNGLGAQLIPYTNGGVTLPKDIQGFSYIILTNAGAVADVTTANTVAGPAIVNSPFDAFQSNPGFMNPYGA